MSAAAYCRSAVLNGIDLNSSTCTYTYCSYLVPRVAGNNHTSSPGGDGPGKHERRRFSLGSRALVVGTSPAAAVHGATSKQQDKRSGGCVISRVVLCTVCTWYHLRRFTLFGESTAKSRVEAERVSMLLSLKSTISDSQDAASWNAPVLLSTKVLRTSARVR